MIRLEIDKRFRKLNTILCHEDPCREVANEDLKKAITSFTFDNGFLIK